MEKSGNAHLLPRVDDILVSIIHFLLGLNYAVIMALKHNAI